MQKLELKKYGVSIGAGAPLCFMMGLNVLEDEGLALETARELKKITPNFIFKASFDKANRSSVKSYRGPGIEAGLKILEKIKGLNIPIVTDIHEASQAERVAAIADVVQIPAFLCRQTDLIVAAARAVEKQDAWLHVKKGQFLAPWDVKNIVHKIEEAAPSRKFTVLCERGVSFGYNNLVVDMLGYSEMKKFAPVTIDATHAVQLPGAGKGNAGDNTATGGRREGVAIIAAASVAAGCDGIFLEFHPEPEKAKCDGPSCLPLSSASALVKRLEAIHAIR